MENEVNADNPISGNLSADSNEKKVTDSVKNKDKTKPGVIKRYPVMFTILIGIIAVVAVYFWKDFEGKKKKDEVVKLATEQLIENNQEMMKVLAKPFVWSIRAEMLRDNMEQIDLYTKELVQEKNFQLILLVTPDGVVKISTDKKLQGQAAEGLIDPAMLQTDSVMVMNKDGMLSVAAPVMGYEKKLGLLVMNYLPEKFKLEEK